MPNGNNKRALEWKRLLFRNDWSEVLERFDGNSPSHRDVLSWNLSLNQIEAPKFGFGSLFRSGHRQLA
jgi:hypothetical protein